MTTHVMVDLETLGTLPGSAIRSIGAVPFDPETGWIGAGYYANVDRESCRRAGLVEDPKTVAWWAQQNAEAQAALDVDPLPLSEALIGLAALYADTKAQRLWSHGACFDEPILRVAYGACRIKLPWLFWDVRDTRTVYELGGEKPDKGQGVEHHALDDAVRQAQAVCRAYGRLSRSLARPLDLEPRVLALETDSHPPIELGVLAEAAADAALSRLPRGSDWGVTHTRRRL